MFVSRWTEGLPETKPHSTSTTKASAHIISASTVMATPNTRREVHLCHGLEKGVGEGELNGNNQSDLLPCVTELPNKTVDGTMADPATSSKEETTSQVILCLTSKYLTLCITLRRCSIKLPLIDQIIRVLG